MRLESEQAGLIENGFYAVIIGDHGVARLNRMGMRRTDDHHCRTGCLGSSYAGRRVLPN